MLRAEEVKLFLADLILMEWSLSVDGATLEEACLNNLITERELIELKTRKNKYRLKLREIIKSYRTINKLED